MKEIRRRVFFDISMCMKELGFILPGKKLGNRGKGIIILSKNMLGQLLMELRQRGDGDIIFN